MVGGAGATGALGLLAAACGGKDSNAGRAAMTTTAAKAGGQNADVSIVNYALTLEYVEADFYDQVVNSGQIKDRAIVDLAKRIAEVERQHVEALKGTASSSAASRRPSPRRRSTTCSPRGPTKILRTAATVENLGAAAYLGQAGRIKSKEVLAAALSIHTVEARHAAALNQLVGRGFKGGSALEGSIPDGAFAKAMTMDQVLAQVKPFIAS